MRLCCRIPLAHFAIDIDVSFDARVTAIFGPSGAGKTTLLDAIAGVRAIAQGEIELGGELLFSSARGIDLPPRRRGIGYVPQEGALFPHLSVRNNMLFGADRRRGATASQGIRIDHVVEVLEIGNLLNRSVTDLSGGEAQRVALARAILSNPRLLLLDEPLAALDVGLKERILPYLGRVRDEFAIPMIYVSHNLAEVFTLADWVLMIRQGRLVAQGVPREILSTADAMTELADQQFENLLTASWLESNRESGTTRVRLKSGAELLIPYLERPPKGDLQIGVSADDILLATERPSGISASNVLEGAIRKIDAVDGEAMLRVVAGEEFLVRITSAAVKRLGLKAGAPIFLIIKARSFRVL